MDVVQQEAPSGATERFNGAVPIKRARLDLIAPDAAQVQRRKEAEKAYGRGRKIPCELYHTETKAREINILQ